MQLDEKTPSVEPVTSSEDITEKVEKVDKDIARGEIEAALFVSDRPVSIEDLCTKLKLPEVVVKEILEEFLKGQWEVTSLQVVKIGEDRFIMQVRPEYTSKVKKFASGGLIPEEFMRTLTIIALKQPIRLTLLVRLRGSGTFEHVKNLEERGLVGAVGSGQDQTLTTTDQFADMFGFSRDVAKMKRQLEAQLGIKNNAGNQKEEIITPPIPPPDVDPSTRGATDTLEAPELHPGAAVEQPYPPNQQAQKLVLPREVIKTLSTIALQQPIPLLIIASRRGSAAFEHVQLLMHHGLVRQEEKGSNGNLMTTDMFAETFGLNRDVKKMQAELKADLDILYRVEQGGST